MVVGALVPYFTNPSVVHRLQGVVSVIAGSRYDLVLFDVESVERRDAYLRNVLRRQMIDGLLIISFTPTDKDVVELQQLQLADRSFRCPSPSAKPCRGGQRGRWVSGDAVT
jgi:DNA-binding LacI/PurR family transcriptional regulator